MITLIHGENILESRNYLNEKRGKHQGETIILSGKTVSLGDLKQATESLSILATNRLVIVENLYSRPSKKELTQFISYLITFKTDFDIVLWEAKEITKVGLRKIPSSWEIKRYSLPKVMFAFLESIAPSNNQKMLKLIKDLRKTSGDDFIYLMIVRQIRLLLLAKENALSGMPSWMIGKFFRQAERFTKEQLLNIYKKLLIIDIGQKTGSAPFALGRDLDLLLATV